MASVVRSWAEILATQNLSPGRTLDPVSRWLLITRASVLPMTLCSAAIGGLLALGSGAPVSGSAFALALLGLLLAHAGNNMINDWLDLAAGVDSEGYVRTRYAPHAVLSGLVSERGLIAAIAAVNAADLAILVYLVGQRGWPVAAFALAGLFISVSYVAPPLRLKHRGLGEPGVFVVWGPLMIGGVFYACTGAIAPWVWVASLPYACLVTAVLVGKHVDKLDSDAAKGIRTLPVLLGRARALLLGKLLMIGFFALSGGLLAAGVFGLGTLVLLAALPRLVAVLRVYSRAAPEQAPPGYPLWPLWYTAWAFLLARRAGLLLITGLGLDVLRPLLFG